MSAVITYSVIFVSNYVAVQVLVDPAEQEFVMFVNTNHFCVFAFRRYLGLSTERVMRKKLRKRRNVLFKTELTIYALT